MTLLIDTSHPQVRVALVESGQAVTMREWEGKGRLSAALLEEIESLLTSQNLTFTDIDRVAVHRGGPQSSFTTLRAGIVLGSLLAEATGVELIQIEGESIEEMAQEAGTSKSVQIIEPKYTSPSV